jgi:hypothetical protein
MYLYQSVRQSLGAPRNNEFSLGDQWNSHSPEGAKNNNGEPSARDVALAFEGLGATRGSRGSERAGLDNRLDFAQILPNHWFDQYATLTKITQLHIRLHESDTPTPGS